MVVCSPQVRVRASFQRTSIDRTTNCHWASSYNQPQRIAWYLVPKARNLNEYTYAPYFRVPWLSQSKFSKNRLLAKIICNCGEGVTKLPTPGRLQNEQYTETRHCNRLLCIIIHTSVYTQEKIHVEDHNQRKCWSIKQLCAYVFIYTIQLSWVVKVKMDLHHVKGSNNVTLKVVRMCQHYRVSIMTVVLHISYISSKFMHWR